MLLLGLGQHVPGDDVADLFEIDGRSEKLLLATRRFVAQFAPRQACQIHLDLQIVAIDLVIKLLNDRDLLGIWFFVHLKIWVSINSTLSHIATTSRVALSGGRVGLSTSAMLKADAACSGSGSFLFGPASHRSSVRATQSWLGRSARYPSPGSGRSSHHDCCRWWRLTCGESSDADRVDALTV